MTTRPNAPVTAALAVLIVLQLVMLSSLFAGIPPHPPVKTPLFGIAPFIGAAVAIALAAIFMADTRAGRTLAVLAAVAAAVSFGPQKYLDAAFPLIWPAVITGQVAILTVLVQVLAPVLAGRRAAA